MTGLSKLMETETDPREQFFLHRPSGDGTGRPASGWKERVSRVAGGEREQCGG